MDKLVLIILAIFISPLAVFLKKGLGSAFWINLILYFFCILPGTIHALLIIMED